MTLEEILSRLEGVKGGNGQYSARCPAHDDHNASLSISSGKDGRILLNCFAGCQPADIVDALGLTMQDLFPNSTLEQAFKRPQRGVKPTVATRYDYIDETGVFLYQKTRMSDKSFYWSHKDNFGNWKKGRNRQAVLYNLPCIKGSQRIYLVEGEKDVETMKAAGLPAVSPPDGAKSKWLDSFTEALTGKEIVILPDNDKPGKALAETEAQALQGHVKSIKILDLTKIWPELPEKGDITDLIVKHSGKDIVEELHQLEQSTPEWTLAQSIYTDVFGRVENTPRKSKVLNTISAQALQGKEIPPTEYVVVDMLPQGLSLLASPPKYGKSWFVLDLCLSAAAGHAFLNHRTVKCGCLYLALEDSERRLQDRMNKLLAGEKAPDQFDYATSALDIGQGLIEQLENYLKDNPQTGLIVIDTLQKVRAAAKGNENAYSADYREIGLLKSFADRHGVCLLLVHHLRKMGDDSDPFNRISGTNGIMGAVDTALVLSKQKRSDSQTTLSITGRDIESRDMVLEFSTKTYRWRVLGDADIIAEQRAKQEYDANPIVITIKKLLEQSPNHTWSGTMQDLLDAGKYIARTYLAVNARSLSSKVEKLDKQLFDYDGIIHHRAKHGSGGGKHYFYDSTVHTVDESLGTQTELPNIN